MSLTRHFVRLMDVMGKMLDKEVSGRVDGTSVVASEDVRPALCALTGAPLPKADALAGMKEHNAPVLATRDGRWKLLINADGRRPELYDIPSDPEELHNVATQQPAIVAVLKQKVSAWQTALPATPGRDKFRRY
ncbi:MAG: hypothetical protein EPN23_08150 [Verrucomicrobia bacterium]|nr:MAG: hypothetical protein EPN23_08150 [Verrucomicrobiota bacterium]